MIDVTDDGLAHTLNPLIVELKMPRVIFTSHCYQASHQTQSLKPLNLTEQLEYENAPEVHNKL